jgi:glutamate dehydrogenase
MRALEARGLLDRGLEALPSETEVQERARAGSGLTRPELAVLLSYAKIALQQDILQSRVPDDPQLESWLVGYFPPLLRERFRAGIDAHSLRREIIALGLTNAVVNRGGPAMAVRLAAETQRPAAEVAHAFMAVREVFDLPRLWQRIDGLDGKVAGAAQLDLYEATREVTNRQTRWFLRRGVAIGDLAATIARHRSGLAALTGALESAIPPRNKSRLEREAARLARSAVPPDLAEDIARLEVLARAPAITEIAYAAGKPVSETAHVFFEIGERLGIDDLARRGAAISTADHYDRLAIAKVLDQLGAAQAAFTHEAMRAGDWQAWSSGRGDRIAQARQTLEETAGESALTLSRLLVAAAALDGLAAGGR